MHFQSLAWIILLKYPKTRVRRIVNSLRFPCEVCHESFHLWRQRGFSSLWEEMSTLQRILLKYWYHLAVSGSFVEHETSVYSRRNLEIIHSRSISQISGPWVFSLSDSTALHRWASGFHRYHSIHLKHYFQTTESLPLRSCHQIFLAYGYL